MDGRLRDEEDVRAELHERLDEEPRSDVWDTLVELGRVELVLEARESADVDEEMAELAHYYEVLARNRPATSTPRSEGRAPQTIARSTAELQSRWLAEILALDAAAEPDVVQFRGEVLGDRLIDAAQVPAWIAQQSEREGPETEDRRTFLTLSVRSHKPYEQAIKLAAQTLQPVLSEQELAELGRTLVQDLGRKVFHERDATEEYGFHSDRRTPFGEGQANLLRYAIPGEPAKSGVVYVATGGVLDRLRRLARNLAQKYLWGVPDAVTFVLAGQTPEPHANRARVNWHVKYPPMDRITVTTYRTVQPKQVAAFYTDARRNLELLSQQSRQRYRPMTEKHLALAVFGRKHSGERGEDRVRLWNEQCEAWGRRDWKYGPARQNNFTRDAKRALDRLTDRRQQGG